MRKITTLLFVLYVAVSMAQAKSQASSPANKPNIQPDAQRPIATRLKNSPALVKAARDNDLEKVKKLLEQGADPNSTAKIKGTKGDKVKSEYNPLEVAIRNKNDEMKQLLLDAGAKGTNATLWYAIDTKDIKLARTLVDQGASLDYNHNWCGIFTVDFANAGNIEGVHVMLDVCPKDAMKAVYVPNFNKEIVQLFVDYGTDIAKQEQIENFFVAIKNNDYDGVMAAIEAGVNVSEGYLFLNTTTAKKEKGQHPLYFNYQASRNANADKEMEANLKILSALLAAGSYMRDFDDRKSLISWSLYHCELKDGPRKEFHRERMRLLINAGFPVPTDDAGLRVYNLLMNPNAVPQQPRNTAKPQKSSGVLDTVVNGLGSVVGQTVGTRMEQKTGNIGLGTAVGTALSGTGKAESSANGKGACKWHDLDLSSNACNKCVNTKPRTQAACSACCNSIGQVGLYSSKYYATDPAAGTKSAGYFQPGCYCNYSNGKSYKF